MNHQSSFALRTLGGECAGEQWICDGDEPIARLETRTVEQPEQNLRYFDRNLKPVNLRAIKLRPGGRPLVAGFQLYWNIQQPRLTRLEVEGQDSPELTLHVHTADPDGAASCRRTLCLRWDPGLQSYIYDFSDHLVLHSPEMFDADAETAFEYSDPWYTDVPAPSVESPGLWPKRYSHLLAEKADGGVWQMPLNHMATGIPAPRSFKENGLFVLGCEDGANPAFEFVGETAERSAVSICNWGYDVHINMRFNRAELYRPICPRLRLRLCPDDKARRMLETAEAVPPVLYEGHDELPLYQRQTSFAAGLKLDRPSPGPTDPWPWLPKGPGCAWRRDFGRSDDCSLAIVNDRPGPAEWTMDREGDGAWTQKWTPSTGFRFSAYIKTEGVGDGFAFIALRWTVYNYPQRFPYLCSAKLDGSRDWTRVEVELRGPPPPGISGACLILRLDGRGSAFFDDCALELLD